jgi:hypothetical protein
LNVPIVVVCVDAKIIQLPHTLTFFLLRIPDEVVDGEDDVVDGEDGVVDGEDGIVDGEDGDAGEE